jgi:hypothetical protein
MLYFGKTAILYFISFWVLSWFIIKLPPSPIIVALSSFSVGAGTLLSSNTSFKEANLPYLPD